MLIHINNQTYARFNLLSFQGYDGGTAASALVKTTPIIVVLEATSVVMSLDAPPKETIPTLM